MESAPSAPAGPQKVSTPAQRTPVYAFGQGVMPIAPLPDETKKPEPSEASANSGERRPGDELQEPENAASAENREEATETRRALESESDQASSAPVEPLPNISGTGEPYQTVAYGLKLRGRTDASFSSSFQTIDVEVTAGRGCKGCQPGNCVRARGILESAFTVTTAVTLPSVSDFPDLTPCQRQRVQDAIDNTLAPHEQQHVAAFGQYNGTVRTPFDLTLCRNTFDARIQAMHDSMDRARQAAARAASARLDPFEFDVDLNCEDPPDAGARRSSTSAPDVNASPQS
jgi:hypothetical protein